MCLAISGPASAETTLLDWSELHSWKNDNHEAALKVFLTTCGDVKDADWPAICELAKSATDARTFFEAFFRPVFIDDGEDALFTGYYEPEVFGSRLPSRRFRYPLYRMPPDVPSEGPWLSREEIESTGALENRGLEIVWLEDPVEKFFLQIQGSGRVKLENGETLRVGYGGKNGHPYSSIGVELVRRGIFQEHEVSAQVIRRWVKDNPNEGARLLWHNASYVFFREVTEVPFDLGPLGAMNRSITSERSIAVDPEFVPLGAPVWIEKNGRRPMRRLMIAQDTGSAIKGAQRADIFYGTGQEAGMKAGRVRDGGRMVVLLPVEQALSLSEGN